MAYPRTAAGGRPPEPLGIGRCRNCAYLNAGTSEICYRCARRTIEPLRPVDDRCMICDQVLRPDGRCGNRICSWDIGERYFEWNFAIAMRSGVLQTAIDAFKYSNRWGWRIIFARVLVGFLDEKSSTFGDFDLIVASPTFLDPDGDRDYDHTREVILAADDEADGRWPFDTEEPASIIKSAATTRFVGHGWTERRQIAETELRAALAVPDPDRTRGRSILVYDDVFTDGFTLREVARSLITEGGATSVCGVTLTRQPWSR